MASAIRTVWLLVLVTMVLRRARAGPVPTSKPTTTGTVCHMDGFKSLSPRELEAFKKAKDALEEWLRPRDCSCSSHPFPKTWDLRQLQVWERPVALQARLALTLEVLGNVSDSGLGDVLDQPLRTLRHLHSRLPACAPAQPTAGPRPRSHRLSHWLHRLRDAQEKESPGCLEASVTFNLFRLLTRDLRCVAMGDLCV